MWRWTFGVIFASMGENIKPMNTPVVTETEFLQQIQPFSDSGIPISSIPSQLLQKSACLRENKMRWNDFRWTEFGEPSKGDAAFWTLDIADFCLVHVPDLFKRILFIKPCGFPHQTKDWLPNACEHIMSWKQNHQTQVPDAAVMTVKTERSLDEHILAEVIHLSPIKLHLLQLMLVLLQVKPCCLSETNLAGRTWENSGIVDGITSTVASYVEAKTISIDTSITLLTLCKSNVFCVFMYLHITLSWRITLSDKPEKQWVTFQNTFEAIRPDIIFLGVPGLLQMGNECCESLALLFFDLASNGIWKPLRPNGRHCFDADRGIQTESNWANVGLLWCNPFGLSSICLNWNSIEDRELKAFFTETSKS